MRGNSLNVLIAATAALLLVFMVLLFISLNPWLLVGIATVLWAIAEIVKAIHGPLGRSSGARRRSGPDENGEHSDAKHDTDQQGDIEPR